MNTSAEYTAIINLIYPVGSIYYAINDNLDPTKWIPSTTWKLVTEGRYLVNEGKAHSNASREFKHGDLGGEKEVTLTESQLPRHTHEKVYHHKKSQFWFGKEDSMRYMTQYGSGKVFTDSVGGDQPHNNIPPSVLIYAWERIT